MEPLDLLYLGVAVIVAVSHPPNKFGGLKKP